ncbi:MAG: DNA polymerase III subunit delta' [Salinisphaeraceae bacterium]|nr:DNA polymerase III subunit delta' [Salinisphaeraceae bacterium]
MADTDLDEADERRPYCFAPPHWQAQAWQTLRTGLLRGRLSHALLISGAPGVGKGSFADAATAALLCETPSGEGEACGACRSCVQLGARSHPDLAVLAPEPDKRWISIEQIRAFSERLHLKSQYGRGRIGLIDPADALLPQAANALLKTLEEPAPGNHLFLLSHRPSLLLPTIRSRCQMLNLPLPDEAGAAQWLTGEWEITASALALAGGAPFEARRRHEAGISARYSAWFSDFLKFLRGRVDPVSLANRWRDEPPQELVGFLGLICCDLLRLRFGADPKRARTATQATALGGVLAAVEAGKLADNLSTLVSAQRLLNSNADKLLILEDLLIRLADCRKPGAS